MWELLSALEIIYAFVGALLVAGIGAILLMIAVSQISARIAVWYDLIRVFRERKALLIEVHQLRSDLETLHSTFDEGEGKEAGPNALVTTVKVAEPKGQYE